MNFGFVSLDTFVAPPTSNPSELGSANVKQQRSVSDPNIEDQQQQLWRASKAPKTMPLTQDMVTSPILRSDQILSFSSNKSEPTFPYYQRNMSRYSSGYGASANMQMGLSNRGQIFTASQWIELEHQALIYKYLTSNVPVPSNLLLPLKKSLINNPFGFTSSNNFVPPLPHNSFGFGWGSFQMGYGDNSDPEPGRCRRTDGKKWRCSRDAVVDQKYCDKHINRGRHRSRKPVEGQLQIGQTSSVATAAAAVKPPPPSGRHSNADSALVNGISSSSSNVDPKQEPVFGLISGADNSNSNYNYSSSRSSISWAHEAQPEWTQLSMALPVSPLRLSQQQQDDWGPLPLSWGPLGGPLGEALTNNNSNTSSSPTGVLHKSTFCSLSNSSAGSSPRTADHQNANAK